MHARQNNDATETLVDSFYRRIGELSSHVARYDMYVLQLLRVLTEEPVLRELAQEWTAEVRTDVIARLMEARGIGAELQTEFTAINAEMRPLLKRQIKSVRSAAGGPHADARNGVAPDSMSSREELAASVAAIERDISTTVKLYLMLGTLTTRLKGDRPSPPPTRAGHALH